MPFFILRVMLEEYPVDQAVGIISRGGEQQWCEHRQKQPECLAKRTSSRINVLDST